MNAKMRQDANWIVQRAIAAAMPEQAMERALKGRSFSGRVYLVAVGKAAWKMAETAAHLLGNAVAAGIVITKYEHVIASIPGIDCFEGGHPIPDENGVRGTQAALDMTENLQAEDTVLFLLSGGASALFEKPLIPLQELQKINQHLLAAGCDITEINTIRKRLSAVKGGRFAKWCAPAQVETIVLSDVLGDPLDMIASGPTVPDTSTCQQALEIIERYSIEISPAARALLQQETPKTLKDTKTQIIGSVRQLCHAATDACRGLGYQPILLTDVLSCEAREAGLFLSSILAAHAQDGRKLAFLAGGETVVHLKGTGLGGRNQELALAAAAGIAGLSHAAVISVGSDGTDGPTDAAGGYVDGDTCKELRDKGLSYARMLENNDAYHALQAVNGLVVTGPTGTNVNDISIALLG